MLGQGVHCSNTASFTEPVHVCLSSSDFILNLCTVNFTYIALNFIYLKAGDIYLNGSTEEHHEMYSRPLSDIAEQVSL
jgi:hypothetical protein